MGVLDGLANTAGNAYSTVAGAADHLAGSTDEALGRQFDDEPGGGTFDPDTYVPNDWDPDDPDNFGDGGNRWIPGFLETVRNPVDRITSPWETTRGALDAAALNFDEGVGGLTSLVDGQPGNTAGSGQQGVNTTLLGGWILIPIIAAALFVLAPYVDVLSGVLGEE